METADQCEMKSMEPQNGFEAWDAGGSDSYLYTEVWEFAKELKKEFRRCASYHNGSRSFGWQFKIPKKLVRILKTRFRKLMMSQAESAARLTDENQ